MKLVNTHILVSLFLLQLLVVPASMAQQWSLQQCLDSAQLRNKNLQIASNKMVISDQKQREAKSNLLPKLTANGEYKYFTDLPHQLMPLNTFNPLAPASEFKDVQFGVPHNLNANLQLAIPLYNPKIYGGIEATRIASELSGLEYEKNKEMVFFEISNLYYNAQILQTQISFLDSNLSNANKLLKNLDLLHSHLLITGTDVEKVHLQIAQLSTQKTTVENKLIQVLNALKFTIGIPSDTHFEIEQEIVADKSNELSPKASIDARMVKIQFELLNSELKTMNNTRYLPQINLIGSYGTTGFGYDKKPNAFLDFYPLGFAGIQISYPIFNGSTTLRKASQKKIEIANNELKSDLIKDQNAMQIDNAKMQKTTSYLAIETSKQQVELAQNIYNNTVLQQKQGMASLTEVLLADNALREAQQGHISAIVEYLKSDLELKKLTGNLLSL
ncbi:MAG: TolC family protein [Flavobacteriales bacterium]|nr:TolC family protein [Flavobacteriales bacterium]